MSALEALREAVRATDGIAAYVLYYCLLCNTLNALLLVLATSSMHRHLTTRAKDRRWLLLSSAVAPCITMIAPAYEEQETVVDSITSLMTLSYPALEVVVVNDGSSDETLARLVEEFDLVPMPVVYRKRVETQDVRGVYRSRREPNLLVVDKVNGGKADALNAGLNICSGELVCTIDADTIVEDDALLRMVRPFVDRTDCLAVGGTIRVVNGSEVVHGRVVTPRAPRTWLAGIQYVEYLRAFLFGRLGWNSLGGNLIISGAFGLFRKESVLAAGGYLHGTVGEDMELVARLRATSPRGAPTVVQFVPDPVAWTEVPETLAVLGRQRDRWHRGLSDVLWRYRGSILSPRKGRLGLVVYPYFLFVELLAPVVEGFGLLYMGARMLLGIADLRFVLAFVVLTYVFGLVLSLWAIALDGVAFPRGHRRRDELLLILWAVAEQVGYRQLTIVWRLRGIREYLRGSTEWGAMTRRGFAVRLEAEGAPAAVPAVPAAPAVLAAPAVPALAAPTGASSAQGGPPRQASARSLGT